MTNDRWKETWKNKHLCFKWQMTAERKHKKTNTCASNDKWPLKGNIKKQTPVLQTTNNCWTETWKNTLEKLKVLYTRKCKRLGITYDVQICCICSENHETGHFLHHWEMTFWAYSVLALYKAHQLMRSTKVQTLAYCTCVVPLIDGRRAMSICLCSVKEGTHTHLTHEVGTTSPIFPTLLKAAFFRVSRKKWWVMLPIFQNQKLIGK